MTTPVTAEDKRVALAAVAGAHGIKGEVRLKLFTDGIETLKGAETLFVGGTPRKIAVRQGGKVAIAKIDGVADRNAAEALRGTLIEIDREALPPLEEGEYYHADLIGLTCFSKEDETIGSVVGVENYGAGDLLDIELVSGKRALIPYKDGIADMVDAHIVLDADFLA